jgi:hypothetical protein
LQTGLQFSTSYLWFYSFLFYSLYSVQTAPKNN